MKKLTLTLALVIASIGAAQAAETVLVSKNVSGDLTYVYSNTLKVKGNARAAWVLTSYKNPLKGQVYSDKAYTVFDCAVLINLHKSEVIENDKWLACAGTTLKTSKARADNSLRYGAFREGREYGNTVSLNRQVGATSGHKQLT